MVVVVTLNGTHGTSGFGGRAAAPVFHAVATEALRVLDVPKDLPDERRPNAGAKTNRSGRRLAIADLGAEGPNILRRSGAMPTIPPTAAEPPQAPPKCPISAA